MNGSGSKIPSELSHRDKVFIAITAYVAKTSTATSCKDFVNEVLEAESAYYKRDGKMNVG